MDSTAWSILIPVMTAAIVAASAALGAYLNGRMRTKTDVENLRLAAEAAAKKQYDERADKGYEYLITTYGARLKDIELKNELLSKEHFACGQKLAGYEAQVIALLEDIKQLRDRENEYVLRIVKLERALGIGSDPNKQGT